MRHHYFKVVWFCGNLVLRSGFRVLGYQLCSEAINKIDEAPEVRKLLAAHMEDEAHGFSARVAELANNRNFFKVALETCVYDLALKGDLVFVGGGAHIILEEYPCLFAVQVVRNLRDRIKAIADEKHISYDNAFDLVKKRDRHKVNFVRHYFDRDLFDPTMFHITINASRVPIDDAVEMVASQAGKTFSFADDQAASYS